MSEDRPAVQADPPRGCGPQHVVVGGVSSVVVAFAVLWTVVPYGMIAHDEGQYGQSATRILAGELPHRDFHEMYSGGLSYWHALLFWLFGEQLIVLRRALVVLAMPAVLAAYAIALRFTASSVLAATVAVASVVSMIGTNHAATPTTYLALLSVVITWMLIKDAETNDQQWVVFSGVLCGIAIAIKITGLYTLAAAGLAITFRGTDLPASATIGAGRWASPGWLERLHRGAVAAAAIAAGPVLVAAHPTANTLAYFAVPTVAMGVGLLGAGRRFDPWNMAMRHAILCGGVIAIVLLCMMPWIVADATAPLYEGLFVRPRVRLGSAAYYPPTGLIACVLALPLAAACLTAGGIRHAAWVRWIGAAAVAALLAGGLGAAPGSALAGNPMRLALEGWRWFPTIAFPVAAIMLTRAARYRSGETASVFATLAMAAFFALNQYPFASPIYFFFAAPTTILAAAAIAGLAARLSDRSQADRQAVSRVGEVWPPAGGLAPAVACAAALAGFCLLRFGSEGFFREFDPRPDLTPRQTLSGLVLPAWRAEPYAVLRDVVDTALRSDQTILAGPDCPEVYFFTGRPNLTPVMYDVFADRDEFEAQLVSLAGDDRIGAVVFNTMPQFSPLWGEHLGRRLTTRMQQRAEAGKFVIYFDPAADPALDPTGRQMERRPAP